MEKYYLQTIGAQIVSDHGERLGRVGDIVVNPDSGKVVGLLLAPARRKVVAPIDILSWTNYIKVHDAHDIVDIDEVQQITRVIEKEIPIHRNKVFTKNGDFIGQVIDYGLDNKHLTLTCLVVAKGFLGIIFWDKRIIAASDIIEITKKGITVKDLVRPVKMKKLKVATSP